MEMKNITFAAIIMACLAVSYYFVIALPNQNKEKLALEKQKFETEREEKMKKEVAAQQEKDEQKLKESVQQFDYNNCFVSAAKSYHADWERNCSKRNLDSDCSLPGYIADSLDKTRKETQEECRRVYLGR